MEEPSELFLCELYDFLGETALFGLEEKFQHNEQIFSVARLGRTNNHTHAVIVVDQQLSAASETSQRCGSLQQVEFVLDDLGQVLAEQTDDFGFF